MTQQVLEGLIIGLSFFGGCSNFCFSFITLV